MARDSTDETRIHVRVRGPLAAYVQSLIGPDGLYENQSEYIRDLIRRDMERSSGYDLRSSLLRSYEDLASGNYRERSMAEIIEEAEREERGEG